MSKQIDFLKRCIALNLQSGGLLDLLDRIEELERERDALQADNAELVAALETVIANAPEPYCAITRAVDAQCRAAIAKVRKP